jgi:hypothetical protein
MRDIEDMRSIAKEYDLKLLEDVADLPTPIETPSHETEICTP